MKWAGQLGVGFGLAALALLALNAAAGNETEPNDVPANANDLFATEVSVGESGPTDPDYWAVNASTGGFAFVEFQLGGGAYGKANLTFEPAGPCARVDYSEEDTLVLNVTAGQPCPFRVDTFDTYTYVLKWRLRNTTSELTEVSGEVEPDEENANQRGNGQLGGWTGQLDPELDPVDVWAFTAPEGPHYIEFESYALYTNGNYTLEVRSGNVVIDATQMSTGDYHYRGRYLTPPANRTLVVALGAADATVFYTFQFKATKVNFTDPLVPSTSELEGLYLTGWGYTPAQDARVSPAEDRALPEGNGTVYGKALCAVNAFGNPEVTFRVDLARTFGPGAGATGGFVSARNQTAVVHRGTPACFDVLSLRMDWRHAGPGSSYFHSGIFYLTVMTTNAVELKRLFNHFNDTGRVDQVTQLAFWSLAYDADTDGAEVLGASSATIADTKALLTALNITTALNRPPAPPAPPPGFSNNTGMSAGFWSMMGLGGIVAIVAAVWVWEPPFLYRSKRKR